MIAYWERNFGTEIIVNVLEFLNYCIYGLVSTLCKAFTELSNVVLFNGEVVGEFTRRIYVVLGIYMLFRLAISLLNSVVNPDNFLDKEKGMQKIITRSVIALAMLVMVPPVFTFALQQQDTIARAVPKLILGKGSIDDIDKQGEILASTALKAFIIPNQECGESTTDGVLNAETQSSLQDMMTSDLSTVVDLPSKACISDREKFAFEFNGVVSMVAGIFLVVSLASYCIDVAVRCIKLGLLQILAPIPIVSYIDPKSEKDGAFGHWTKECISTYVEVFIKHAILYFVIFILAQLATDNGAIIGMNSNANNSNTFAYVQVIEKEEISEHTLSNGYHSLMLAATVNSNAVNNNVSKMVSLTQNTDQDVLQSNLVNNNSNSFAVMQIDNENDSNTLITSTDGTKNTVSPLVMVFLIIGSFFFMGKAADFICNILGVKRNKDSGGFLGKTLGFLGGGLAGAGVGAVGGLIAGGGLAGAAAGALNGMATDGAGKPLGAFNKGREISALMRGQEKPTSLNQKAQNAIMRRNAAKMGITNETLDEAKKARDYASSRFDVAQSLLQQAPDGSMIEWDGKQYTKEEFSNFVYNGKDSLSAQMKKRASVYDEMKSQGAKWHVGKAVETYSDKYRDTVAREDYKPVANSYKTPSHSIILPGSSSSVASTPANTSVTGVPSGTVSSSAPSILGDRISAEYNNFESPTREEHLNKQAELNSVFFDPANSAYLDAVEAEAAANEKRATQQNARTSHTTDSGIILNATESDFRAARDANNNNNR